MPVFAAWACAIVALVCLLGWIGGVESLTSIVPGLPAMVPMTALLTLLASVGLRLSQRDLRHPAVRWPAAALAASASAILLAYAAQDLGMLGHAVERRGLWGVSSPITATMFLGLGISLLALPSRRFIAHSQWSSLAVLFVSLLTLAGYLFRDTFLYRLLPGTGTSILTALVLLMLSAGCLVSRQAEGIMAAVTGNAPGAQIARRLLVSAVAMPLLIGLAVWIALNLTLIDIDTAITLLVWGIMAFFVIITWQGALRLNRADAARRHAEGALVDALAALREADANKDRFMAVLAHELRNPLAPVRAAADLLRLPAGVDAAQQRRAGDIIARQVEHMSHLIEDLLDVSRVRQGLITIDQEPVDLHAVLKDAQEQTRPQMAQRRHRLHAELPDEHPLVVVGDHQRLVQVVVNLLVNAAKYTPEGGEIVLALHAAPDQAVISVRDNGTGIDAALLGRVFDSFTQEMRNPERGEGGLGIGLALVRSLVELHGGAVSAHSEGKGKGSCFVVKLPRQRVA